MGSSVIMCPMCCNESFSNLRSLKYHLLSMTDNLYCPGCSLRSDSVDDLIRHLDKCGNDDDDGDDDDHDHGNRQSNNNNNDDDETPTESNNYKDTEMLMETIVEEITFLNPVNNQEMIISDARTLKVEENVIESLDKPLKGDIDSPKTISTSDVDIERDDPDKDPAESKDSPVIRIPERLNQNDNENEDNVLAILPEDSAEFLDTDQNLMEIQHQEGELNEEELMKVKQEICEVKEEEEIDSTTVYNCSSCGVSFNSVIDHIKEYHEGQDVIVEVNGDMTQTEDLPAEETIENTKQGLGTRSHQRQKMNTLRTEECVDSEGRRYTRKVVQIERFWDKKDKSINSAKMIEKFFANPENEPKPLSLSSTKTRKNEMPQRMYRCNQCLEQFSKLGEFRNHACCNGSNQCDNCDQAFATVKALQLHMKVHGPDASPTKKSFVCRICGTQFASHKSLRLHSRMHAPVRARHVDAPEGKPTASFTCLECGKTLSVSYREAHMSLHAGDTATCGICNRKFDSAESLAMHAAVHPELGVVQVSSGQQVTEPSSPTSNTSASTTATAGVDNDLDLTKPYQCQHCGRRFTRPHEKVKHERIHTGEKPHVCEVCGKKFRVSYCLTLHMRTHTGVRPYHCQHCNKRFKASSVYNHHLLTHGEERAYTCPYCPKTFKTRVQLAGHKNSHTKPFRCTECSRPFASLYAARAHIQTHKKDNNLKFTCHICGASYGRAFALKDHLKIHSSEADPILPPEPAREEEIQEDFLLNEEEMLEEMLDT
ncbi:zinc finger protein 595 isoform X2 [Microplitis demolitor]|uniref:zinc finger protein 595 isoform X2 n=1 Tax=Microplitis demolitor TaxID=69319 RepID=UPI0004CCB28A|nr:zinc finger protein 595 isoform X2 [Microplitis demolitor]